MKKLSLGTAQEEAKKRGGKCLSADYVNCREYMKWQCTMGHIFDIPLGSVRAGHWCKKCHVDSIKLTIEDAHAEAEKHGGKCLSTEYINNATDMKWQCAEKHVWDAPMEYIRKGNWCRDCAGTKKLTLEIAQQEAKVRGGICLSTEYIGVDDKLLWECALKHNFPMSLSHVRNCGRWCPRCTNLNTSEEICRAYFEHMLGYKFPKFRATWLVNDAGNRTELDGFCPELKLAFEHHGEQHYRFINFFHDTTERFEKRQKDDAQKIAVCVENGINVIVIPQLFQLTSLELLPDTIERECRLLGINVVQRTDNIDLTHVYATKRLDKYIAIATERGITYISGTYITCQTKIKWMCAEGHLFDASCAHIQAGHGCRKCANINNSKRLKTKP